MERTAQDWSNGVAHPDWLIKLITTKYKAVEGAWRVADTAFELSGGFGIFKKMSWNGCFAMHASAAVPRQLLAEPGIGGRAGPGHQSGCDAAVGIAPEHLGRRAERLTHPEVSQ